MLKKRLYNYSIKHNRTTVPICGFCHAEEGEKRKIGQPPVILTTIDVLGTTKKACLSCARRCEEILLQQNTQLDERTKQKLWKIAKQF